MASTAKMRPPYSTDDTTTCRRIPEIVAVTVYRCVAGNYHTVDTHGFQQPQLHGASGTYELRLSDAGPHGRSVACGRAPFGCQESEVALDGEVRPRIERRGFDLALPNGPHHGQARIPPLLCLAQLLLHPGPLRRRDTSVQACTVLRPTPTGRAAGVRRRAAIAGLLTCSFRASTSALRGGVA